jgi:hypothetical protein
MSLPSRCDSLPILVEHGSTSPDERPQLALIERASSACLAAGDLQQIHAT